MKYFFTTVIACILAMFTAVSNAESQSYIILHGASEHGKLGKQVWQERNHGVGYRLQQDQSLGYQIGTYRNSYDKQTVYAVAQYTPIGNNTVRVGAFGGVATAYSSPVVGGFMLKYYQDKAVYTVRHVPKINKNTTNVTTFEMGFKF